MGGVTVYSTAYSIWGIPPALGITCVKALSRKDSRKKGKAGVGEEEENKGVRTQGGHWKRLWGDFRLHQGRWKVMIRQGWDREPWHRVKTGPQGGKQEAEREQEARSGEGEWRPDQGNGCTDGLMRAGAKEIKR